MQGSYTLTVRKNGYETSTQTVVVNPTSWSVHDVYLQPLQQSWYNGTMICDGQPVDGEIIVFDTENDTIDVVDGSFSIHSWTGDRKVIFRAEGCETCIEDAFTFEAGIHGLVVELSPADVLYQEDFDDANDLSVDINGPWQVIDELAWMGSAITDSWGGNGFYAPNCDVNITTQDPVALSGYDHYNLEFMQNLYTEADFDFARVEISSDGETWEEIWNDTGKKDWWNRVIIPLDDYADDTLYFRFRLTADSPDAVLVDPGWTIDNLRITGGSFTVTEVDPDSIPDFTRTQLNPNYPNPFNPVTIFSYSIPSSARNAEINVYNTRGQRVEKIVLSRQDMERGSVAWDAVSQASGIYFYRLKVDGKTTITRKACLIK